MSNEFIQEDLTRESNWRGIVLMGRNVASYKFALAESLLNINKTDQEIVKLEDIAIPYSAAICRHLKSAERQITARSSRFLQACRQFNSGEITHDELIEETVRRGFQNVIDAFHNVAGEEVPVRFFQDVRTSHHGIRLTEDFYKLFENQQIENLPQEVEARWKLVETAWELGINTSLLDVSFDTETQSLRRLPRQVHSS